MQEVEGWTRVPRVLDDEAGKNFRPMGWGDWSGPASDPMPMQGLNYMRTRELQRTVSLAEMPLILPGVG
jgi:hypothetical protein